ncbi:hypothetical protein WICMUC_000080 [Wickerhamomyces mucosus]|uniref:alpha,alpha-trehalase n=1 Tax=Wickerhamomyces mucosus TaxID=1378264 RepID=A0A9P8Q0F6_9ASCO|nr:hypothetical protein WICMUC_000080 [Wickerhamomyces mucosus]
MILPIILISYSSNLVIALEAILRPTVIHTVERNNNIDTRCKDPEILELCRKSNKIFEALSDAYHCFYDEDNNILGNSMFSSNMYSRQPYVSNGYIGARISTLGQGFSYDEINIHADISNDEQVLKNGWPLFNKRYTGAFVAGFFSLQERLPSTNFPELYDNGYDSVISSIPYWINFEIELQNNDDDDGVYRFNPNFIDQYQIMDYHQNMSIQNGLISTKLIWLKKLQIQIDVLTHKEILPLGLMRLKLIPLVSNLNITIRDCLNFSTSQRTSLSNLGFDGNGIFMEVQPQNVNYSTASIYSSWDIPNSIKYYDDDNTSVINEANISLSLGIEYRMKKYVGIVSTELDSNLKGKELIHAREIVKRAKLQGEELLYQTHCKEWERQFQETNVYIPSNKLLTLAARSSLFHILSNTQQHSHGLTSALGTSGLSSDSYGGMVFWDSDLWIIPGILPFAPKIAKAISLYRNYTHDQAIKNAQQSNFPTNINLNSKNFDKGAAYPWTSGRFGNCTSTGPCIDYEYHINVDIAFSSWAIYLAGESEEYLRYTTWPLLRDASNFLSQYVQFDELLQKFVTYNLTDPDEYANHIDNGAFTNDGIDKLLQKTILVAKHLNELINPRWIEVMGNIHIPKSIDNITLEYTDMNSSVKIKQADVVLLTFPLDYSDDDNDEDSINQSTRDLFYYSLKQADIGPAMTFPIFSIVSSRLLGYGCSSQSYLLKSVLPYIRSPFAQFSEQADDNFLTNGGTYPAFPFLTASAGYLQALIYGILGLKYSERFIEETQKIQRVLKFDPVKPLALPGGLTVTGFKFMQQNLDIIITDNEGIIIHRGNQPILIEVNKRNDEAGDYWLLPKTELKVPNYIPLRNIAKSLCECKLITNLTTGAPGEVALSAIDGNNYTYWQPFNRYKPGKLFIDLGEIKSIKEGFIIWGNRPAKFISIYATSNTFNIGFDEALLNIDNLQLVKILDRYEIIASSPFIQQDSDEVKLLPHNETAFKIDEQFGMVSTRFIIFEVDDVLDEDGITGATINEFALF